MLTSGPRDQAAVPIEARPAPPSTTSAIAAAASSRPTSGASCERCATSSAYLRRGIRDGDPVPGTRRVRARLKPGEPETRLFLVIRRTWFGIPALYRDAPHLHGSAGRRGEGARRPVVRRIRAATRSTAPTPPAPPSDSPKTATPSAAAVSGSSRPTMPATVAGTRRRARREERVGDARWARGPGREERRGADQVTAGRALEGEDGREEERGEPEGDRSHGERPLATGRA